MEYFDDVVRQFKFMSVTDGVGVILFGLALAAFATYVGLRLRREYASRKMNLDEVFAAVAIAGLSAAVAVLFIVMGASEIIYS